MNESTTKALIIENQAYQQRAQQILKERVSFDCLGKKVIMSVQELIDHYINTECADVEKNVDFNNHERNQLPPLPTLSRRSQMAP